jgi:hypothetical protein
LTTLTTSRSRPPSAPPGCASPAASTRAKKATARVTDLITGERLPDHHVDGGQPSLNTLLMTALDLPDDMRAAARTGGSSNTGARISFADVFSFLYVPQSDINRDIANSQESYREPKRKAVFELLFGLTNPRVLMMRSDLNAFNAKITTAETEYQTVLDFLHDSNTTSRAEAEQAMAAAAAGQAAAEAEHAMLREGIDPVTDRDTLALRDLLTEAERALANARPLPTRQGPDRLHLRHAHRLDRPPPRPGERPAHHAG